MTPQKLLVVGLFLYFVLPVYQGSAQIQQPYRIELDANVSDHPFNIISMGKEGLALVRDTNKYDHGNKKWQLEFLDTALHAVWSTELMLENRLVLVGYEHSPGHLFLLFREEQTTFYNFQLITISIPNRGTEINKVRFDLTFRLTHFTVASNSAVFGGYVNSEPAVLLYNHSDDHPKVLPGLFTKGLTLLDVRTNQNQSFNVLLVENDRSGHSKLILRTFDPNGNLLIDDIVDVDSRYTLLTGFTSTLVHDDMMIAGTYGSGSGRQATGFYSLSVDPFHEQPVTYTDFVSLEHFLDYLPEKKSNKIKAKTVKEKSSAKVPTYKANVTPLRFAEYRDGYYLLAEMFHPAGNVNSYPYSNPNWNNYNNPSMSSGYPNRSNRYDNSSYLPETPIRNSEVRMIQAILLKFRADHVPVKNFSMKFDDLKQGLLDQAGDFLLSRDSAVLAYKRKNEILYQRESGEPDALPVIHQAPVVLKPTDFFKDENEEEGGLRFWYDHHFYIWGYQRIRTTVNEDVQSRYVFYVNRLDL